MIGYWLFLVVTSTGVLAVDQISKLLVVRNLQLFESIQPIPVLYPYFQITRSYNTGAAFGFLSGMGFEGNLFLIIAIVVVSVLLWTYRRLEPGHWLVRVAYALVIGGAVGNAIDRVMYGHVVDFIHYQIPNLIANVSNIADHAIVLGIIMMVWANWQADRKQQAIHHQMEKEHADRE